MRVTTPVLLMVALSTSGCITEEHGDALGLHVRRLQDSPPIFVELFDNETGILAEFVGLLRDADSATGELAAEWTKAQVLRLGEALDDRFMAQHPGEPPAGPYDVKYRAYFYDYVFSQE